MLSLQLPLEKLTYPSSTYEDRENYYIQFLPSQKLDYYHTVYTTHHCTENSVVKQPILFFEIAFGSTYAEVTKKMGRPRFKLEYQSGEVLTQIVFYKQVFFGIDAVIQFHCINNQFIYGSITVPSLEKEIITMFSDILRLKYGVEIPDRNPLSNEYIAADFQGNKIILQHFFYPTLVYIHNNVDFSHFQMANKVEKSKEDIIKQSAWLNNL